MRSTVARGIAATRNPQRIGASGIVVDDDMQAGRARLLTNFGKQEILEPNAGMKELGLMTTQNELRPF